MIRRRPGLVPLALLVLVAGVLTVRLTLAAAQRAGVYQLFDPVVDVEHLLSKHFIRELTDEDYRALQHGAIRGMIDTLDDPYTEFIPSEAIADFDKDVRGEYAGIGAEVNTRDGWLWIATPMEDSPAFKAGIEADDLIVAADGTLTWRKSVDDAVNALTGPPGSTVRLTVERAGDAGDIPTGALPASVADAVGEAPGPAPGRVRFDVDIVRQRIVASTVKGVHRVGDRWDFMTDPVNRIGLVRVTQFTAGTIPELRAALDALVRDGVRGLILDLRFNSGGSLQAAIEMSDLFLQEGTIVSTKGRGAQGERFFATSDGALPDFPMVVMVNGQSASASEIVTGALADNARAKVLGTRSFGKGLVQTMYRLPSGAGQLKITEQHYFLPSGRLLQRTDNSTEWGVDPSPGMHVPMSNDEYRQMLRARRELEIIRSAREGEPHPGEQDWADPEWILATLKDKQLSAAVAAIRGVLSDGQWPVVGEEPTAETLQMAALRAEERRYELLARELERSQRRIDALTDPALASASDAGGPIPGNPDLTGGTVRIFDAQGTEVTALTITGPNLGRWLDGAPVRAPGEEDADE